MEEKSIGSWMAGIKWFIFIIFVWKIKNPSARGELSPKSPRKYGVDLWGCGIWHPYPGEGGGSQLSTIKIKLHNFNLPTTRLWHWYTQIINICTMCVYAAYIGLHCIVQPCRIREFTYVRIYCKNGQVDEKYANRLNSIHSKHKTVQLKVKSYWTNRNLLSYNKD